jgi:hypothetical protein
MNEYQWLLGLHLKDEMPTKVFKTLCKKKKYVKTAEYLLKIYFLFVLMLDMLKAWLPQTSAGLSIIGNAAAGACWAPAGP